MSCTVFYPDTEHVWLSVCVCFHGKWCSAQQPWTSCFSWMDPTAWGRAASRGPNITQSNCARRWTSGQTRFLFSPDFSVFLPLPFSSSLFFFLKTLLCSPLIQVRVGLIQFGSTPRLEFTLDSHATKQELQKHMKRVSYRFVPPLILRRNVYFQE